MTNLRQLGLAGEDLAVQTLQKQGYRIIARNYVTPLGEIDVIARQGEFLVFIEVKTRRSPRFGEAREALSPAKQARLQKLAAFYLKQNRLGPVQVRFDVVAIDFTPGEPRVEIIPGAF